MLNACLVQTGVSVTADLNNAGTERCAGFLPAKARLRFKDYRVYQLLDTILGFATPTDKGGIPEVGSAFCKSESIGLLHVQRIGRRFQKRSKNVRIMLGTDAFSRYPRRRVVLTSINMHWCRSTAQTMMVHNAER